MSCLRKYSQVTSHLTPASQQPIWKGKKIEKKKKRNIDHTYCICILHLIFLLRDILKVEMYIGR